MTTATTTTRPTTTPTTVRVEVERELSGAQWCTRYPGSKDVSKLRQSFQEPVNAFIAAMEAAGATVTPAATYRPKERAYLMEWCWLISRKKIEPENVPHRTGVAIEWVHKTKEQSVAAAQVMSDAYGMQRLHTKPAGESSLHCIGEAIDMNISWSSFLKIQNRDGSDVTITSTPRDETNQDLKKIGATYGVIKFVGGTSDRPHWSTTGN